jgi:hypothetical protein
VASGQVAGAVLSVPIPQKMLAAGLHTLIDLSDIDYTYQRLGLASTRGFVAAHRDVALSVVKASMEAIARMKQDPDGTKKVLAKYLSLDTTNDAATLSETYAVVVQKYLPSLPYPSKSGMQSVLTEAIANNAALAKITVDQLIDNSLVQELDSGGFVNSLGK